MNDCTTYPQALKVQRAGYIYVIGFANGVVKIGRTRNPKNRLQAHATNLGSVSPIQEQWVSPMHVEWVRNENSLRSLLGGREIAVADIAAVLAHAQALTFSAPVHQTPEQLQEALAEQSRAIDASLDRIFGSTRDRVVEDIVQRRVSLFRAWEAIAGNVRWMSEVLATDNLEDMQACLAEVCGELSDIHEMLSDEFVRVAGVRPVLVDEEVMRLARANLPVDALSVEGGAQ